MTESLNFILHDIAQAMERQEGDVRCDCNLMIISYKH